MKKSIPALLVLALIAILSVVAWRSLHEEPVYQGKRLTLWLREYNADNEPITREAIRARGTNVIVFVRRKLRDTDTPLRLKLIALARKQTFIKLHFRTATEGYAEAADACRLAAPSVRGQLVADWIRLVERDPRNNGFASFAARAQPLDVDAQQWNELEAYSLEALVPMLDALSSTNKYVRAFATGYVRYLPSQTSIIVPALEKQLSDTNACVGVNAALSLGYLRQHGFLGPESKTVVPALLHGLDVAAPFGECSFIAALTVFTNEAPSIVPVLRKLVDDTSAMGMVSKAAKDALKQIHPESATRAGGE